MYLGASPDCFTDFDIPGEDIKLWNCLAETKITSGQRIMIRTDDQRKRPLPLFKLLELQWYLQRVAALNDGYDDNNDDATASDNDDYYMWEGSDSGGEYYD